MFVAPTFIIMPIPTGSKKLCVENSNFCNLIVFWALLITLKDVFVLEKELRMLYLPCSSAKFDLCVSTLPHAQQTQE
jgi:hypothetical protein